VAIEHTLTILNWYENLPKKDVPPEHLWADAEGLEQWWKAIEERTGDGSSTGDDYEPPMEQNDLARAFKG